MFGIDLTTALVVFAALVILLFALDLLLAGGGITSAMLGGAMQCGAAMARSAYGWVLIVVLVLVVLGAFGILFGYR